MVIEVMLNEALPLFVSVTFCAPLVVPTLWLANVRLVGDRLTTGAGAVAPVPVRLTLCGLPLALSLMLTAAVRVPVAVGVNVTLMVQLPPLAATLEPQVFV